jgi:hypothetical protein
MSNEAPRSRPDQPHDPGSIVQDAPAGRDAIGRRETFILRSCLGVILAVLIFEGVVLGGTRFGWVGALLGPFVIYASAVAIGLVGTLFCFGLLFLDEVRGRLVAMRKKRLRRGHPLADEELDAPKS